eukprot:m.97972 g.97972  ORF g.97972 m.97972 type:complete len:837 (+) comp13620_c0_seq3:102-2612(+)
MPSQPLPPREHAMFKRILKCYEHKQYKAGLKAAKFILSQPKYAEHGETLALKGLVLNCLDRKEEAYKLVKKGLQNDLFSHVCWHVYGLLYRSDKEYTQAIKCYRSALRYEKENLQIMRDLSLLQIQMRDMEGYKETRHSLLLIRPQQRQSWIGYAISLHLQKQYDEAVRVLTEYEGTQSKIDQKVNERDFEAGELVLYKAKILADGGKLQDALDYIFKNRKRVCDERGMDHMVAEIHLNLGQVDKAEEMYRELLQQNPENENYYYALEKCLKIDGSTPPEKRLELYTQTIKENPKAHTPKRLPLLFSKGEQFRTLLDAYLRPNIKKGMSPVFRNIRLVYSDPEKTAIVEKLACSYVDNLRDSRKFDPNDAKTEPPSTYVWALYFAAQHFDMIGDLEKGMSLINTAIDHTPTVLELYMVKAKIFKHAGNPKEAAYWLNYARELDTADRYINSKCVKYMLRANDIKKAEETIALFTRESGDPIAHLSDMQCIWFETEQARAFARVGEIGKALKKLHLIDSHFEQMIEDQFDFHTYCMRKMTLRAYTGLLNMEDNIKGHKFYVRAALEAISCYVGLHDVPYGSKEREEQDAKLAGLSAAERKKLISKQKKAAKKAEAEKQKNGDNTKQSNKSGDKADKKDDDPDGLKLSKTEKPLEDALTFLKPLLRLSKDRLDCQMAAFEVYYRKQRFLLMLRAIKKAREISPEDPSVHCGWIRFLQARNESKATIHKIVNTVVDEELQEIFGSKERDPVKMNSEFREKYPDSLPHLRAYAEMLAFTQPTKLAEASTLLGSIDITKIKGADLKACRETIKTLRETLKDESTANKFQETCKQKFSMATW